MSHELFEVAKGLEEPWRTHFPKTMDEAKMFQPLHIYVALHTNVLVVAKTRVEVAWAAYCRDVPGIKHEDEVAAVAREGDKMPEKFARVMFPMFDGIPYAH